MILKKYWFMKNKLSDKERLLHILDAIEDIENFTINISYTEYIDDYKLSNCQEITYSIFGKME